MTADWTTEHYQAVIRGMARRITRLEADRLILLREAGKTYHDLLHEQLMEGQDGREHRN